MRKEPETRPGSVTPERLSIMVGVLAAIAATLPRYMAGGHQGRLTLILIAFVVILIVAGVSWRMLAPQAQRRLNGLLGRLLIMLLLGGVLIALWQFFMGGLNPLLMLSHGATLGLLLHALTVGWQRDST